MLSHLVWRLEISVFVFASGGILTLGSRLLLIHKRVNQKSIYDGNDRCHDAGDPTVRKSTGVASPELLHYLRLLQNFGQSEGCFLFEL